MALGILRPLPDYVSKADRRDAHFFVDRVRARRNIVPRDVRPGDGGERVSKIRHRGIGFPLPAFPVPPNDDVTRDAVIRMRAVATISRATLLYGELERFFEGLRLVAGPEGVHLADVLRVPIGNDDRHGKHIASGGRLFTITICLMSVEAVVKDCRLRPMLQEMAKDCPLCRVVGNFSALILAQGEWEA